MSKALINAVALAGMVVAGYALYIEHTHAEAEKQGLTVSFFCDRLVSWASCSAALTGPYGKILSKWGIVAKGGPLDVPNALIGFSFYFLSLLPWNKSSLGFDLYMGASTLSLFFSLYLAYVLKFVIHEFCIICVTSYALNITLFILGARLRLRSEMGELNDAVAAREKRKEKAKASGGGKLE